MALSSDWTLQGLDNPLVVQKLLLDQFASANGNHIVDPNNPASILMEGFASLSSSMIKMIDDTVRPAIYPARSNTAEDLYKHLSDYDYLGIFATPAETQVVMIIDKWYVQQTAIAVPGKKYRKLIIPGTTRFTMGEHVFGMFYPIEIRVDDQTGMFTVVYDTSTENPMKPLTTNIVDFEFREYNNVKLVYLTIPVYQYDITIHSEVLNDNSGLKKDIEYNDKFYSLRCFAEVLTNYGHDATEEDIYEERELSLALSGQTYDPTVPTVVFTPDIENNYLTIEIPYVYFTENRIRGTLYTRIYTTKGELDYRIPSDTEEFCIIDMFSNLDDDTTDMYAEPFRQMPHLNATPISSKITGGTNGISYDELRQRVITDTIRTKTLQTPDDIDAYFANEGYSTTLLRDGITDRIFLAHATVTNEKSETIGADVIGSRFDFVADIDKYDTVVNCGNNVYTILPSTIYKFDKDTGICSPLTNAEREDLFILGAAERVDEFNNNVYTMSPFCLQVDVSNSYPSTVTYDMTDTAITKREFVREREDLPCQVMLNTVNFKSVPETGANSNIKNLYRVYFTIKKNNLEGVVATTPEGVKQIRVVCGLKNDDGIYYFKEALFANYKKELISNENGEVSTDEYDVFYVDIPSNYVFQQANGDHTVGLEFDEVDNSTGANYHQKIYPNFFLRSEMRVILCLKKDISSIGDIVGSGAGKDYLVTNFRNASIFRETGASIGDYVAMSEHKIVLQFGSEVDELDQRINLTYSEEEYKTYGRTKFLIKPCDVFKRDANDRLVLNANHKLTILHDKGEFECTSHEGSIGIYDDPEDTTKFRSGGGSSSMVAYLCDATKANYANCVVVNEDGTIDKVTIPDTSQVEYRPKTVSDLTTFDSDGTNLLNAPVVPQFTLEMRNPKYNYNGTWELSNPNAYKDSDNKPIHNGFATPADKWVKIPVPGTYTADTADYKNASIEMCDALALIYSSITNQFDAEGANNSDTCILTDVKADVGTYVLVVNDRYHDTSLSDAYRVESQSFPISDSDQFCVAQIYCMTEDGWKPVAYAKNEAAFNAILVTNRNPKIYRGIAYKIAWSTTTNNVTTTDATHIGFLTTRTLGNTLIPDFKIIDDTTNHVTESTDPEFHFQVCRYPWDVNEWYNINKIPLTFGGTTKYVVSLVKDSMLTPKLIVPRIIKYCEYTGDQYQLSGGKLVPVSADSRHIVYQIDMFHLDYKLTQVTYDADSEFLGVNTKTIGLSDDYPENVLKILRTHFAKLGAAKTNLFTNTRLFFSPLKSLGYGEFSIGNDRTKILPLDITMKFRLHVPQSSMEDDKLIQEIKDQIINIIDEHIADGHVSCSEIASTIISQCSDSISHVDVLGIDGDPDLQTMKSVDPSVRPHLKHILYLMDDGKHIDADRGLELEVVVNE